MCLPCNVSSALHGRLRYYDHSIPYIPTNIAASSRTSFFFTPVRLMAPSVQSLGRRQARLHGHKHAVTVLLRMPLCRFGTLCRSIGSYTDRNAASAWQRFWHSRRWSLRRPRRRKKSRFLLLLTAAPPAASAANITATTKVNATGAIWILFFHNTFRATDSVHLCSPSERNSHLLLWRVHFCPWSTLSLKTLKLSSRTT